MAFTDRFISLPIQHFNLEEADISGKKDYECEQIETVKKILPMRVESYERANIPGEDFDKKNFKGTNVFMQSGDSFFAYIDIEEFEKLLNSQP